MLRLEMMKTNNVVEELQAAQGKIDSLTRELETEKASKASIVQWALGIRAHNTSLLRRMGTMYQYDQERARVLRKKLDRLEERDEDTGN